MAAAGDLCVLPLLRIEREEALTDVAAEPNPRRWLILAVVGTAFFMTILDVAIVNVAIPSIQTDLSISQQTVEWVIIAYSITFGGFLLLGGRIADLLGRRRIFLVGLVIFTLSSLACGLSHALGSAAVLIGARAVQGLGAAIISPAALSIVTTTFEEGAERNKALGIWGALSAANVVGVLMGMVIFANFFILTLYVQQVLGWSALRTGVTFLATAGTTPIWAGVAQALTTKVGPRPIVTAGLLIMGVALFLYTQIPVHGHFWPDLLPAYLVFAVGLALTFVPVSIAALTGVKSDDAGLASGLLNT